MHSKSPVVNVVERHDTLLANKWLAVCNIHLLIIHCFITLSIFIEVLELEMNCYRYAIILIILYRVRKWYKHFYGVNTAFNHKHLSRILVTTSPLFLSYVIIIFNKTMNYKTKHNKIQQNNSNWHTSILGLVSRRLKIITYTVYIYTGWFKTSATNSEGW